VPPLEPQQKEAHLASCFFPVLEGQSIEEAPEASGDAGGSGVDSE